MKMKVQTMISSAVCILLIGMYSTSHTEGSRSQGADVTPHDPVCRNREIFVEFGAMEALQSPGWPHSYRSNTSCNWLIRAPDGQVIHFTVRSFSTHSSNKLELLDVAVNETLAELSGDINRGVSFTSRSNHVTAKFHSDPIFVDRGFYVNVTAVAPCGFSTEATSQQQTLFSPGWPGSYGNNLDCQWVINSSSDNPIRLHMFRFNTQECCDYLRIMDGNTEIARLSGIRGQKVYTANSGVLKLLFHSDDYSASTGFNSSYFAETPEVFNEILPIVDPYCGKKEIFTEVGAMKTLQSPGWPQSYRSNTTCNWLIYTFVGQVIRFTVDTFSTESCCDKLQLFDVEVNETFAELSGNINRGVSFTSRSNHVTAKFHSDSIFVDRGFSIDFTALDEDERELTTKAPTLAPCGFNAEATREWQMLSSPSWPGSYDNNLDCQWEIRSSVNMPISLNVSRFNTESCCDYLSGECRVSDYYAIRQSFPSPRLHL